MLNLELIKNVLIISVAGSIITTAIVQRIKESFTFKKSSKLVIVSFIVSMVLGTLFSLSFSDATFINSLWAGLISFLGADAIYKAFEDKIFKTFNEIVEEKSTKINEENIIK